MDSPCIGHQPLFLVFGFFNFRHEFLKKLCSSELLHSKMNPTSCLFGLRFVWAQIAIFPPNRAPKMLESQQLFFGLRLVSRIVQHPAIQTKIVQPFGVFFHKIKVRQRIGRKDSIQTVIQTSRRFDLFLYEAAQNFEVFSNIQN
jgi:hypothetical protein